MRYEQASERYVFYDNKTRITLQLNKKVKEYKLINPKEENHKLLMPCLKTLRGKASKTYCINYQRYPPIGIIVISYEEVVERQLPNEIHKSSIGEANKLLGVEHVDFIFSASSITWPSAYQLEVDYFVLYKAEGCACGDEMWDD